MALPRPPQISTDPDVDAAAMFAINGAFDQLEKIPVWRFARDIGYQNSWSDTNADARGVRVFRDATGTVFMAGQATKSSLPAGNENIFALPKGWSPRNSFNILVSASTIPTTMAEIAIGGGVVQFVGIQSGATAPIFLHLVAVFKGES